MQIISSLLKLRIIFFACVTNTRLENFQFSSFIWSRHLSEYDFDFTIQYVHLPNCLGSSGIQHYHCHRQSSSRFPNFYFSFCIFQMEINKTTTFRVCVRVCFVFKCTYVMVAFAKIATMFCQIDEISHTRCTANQFDSIWSFLFLCSATQFTLNVPCSVCFGANLI